MKQTTLTLAILLTTLLAANAQSIQERTSKSDLVIEGKVVKTESFWHKNQTQIFTTNRIKVSRVFKGEIENGFVEVVTQGGTIGEKSIIAVHSPFFTEGEEGIFFCRKSRYFPRPKEATGLVIAPSSGKNSFIEYHPKRRVHPATDKQGVYQDIEKEVYGAISESTGTLPTKIGDNSFEKWHAEWLVKNSVQINTESLADTVMEFSFENITFTNDLGAVSFDVYSKSNVPVRFCEAKVVIEYTTDAFGGYAVTNGNISVTKGAIVQSSNYTLTTSDVGEKKVTAEVIGSYSNVSELYLLTTTPEKLLHIELGIVNPGLLGTVEFDDFAMAGQALFHDGTTDACVPFNKLIVNGTIHSNAIPIVGGFDPDNLNAGISNTLTIWGANFGTVKGRVWFQNADVDLDIFPGTYMHTLESDIIQWDDDTIRVEVPSAETAFNKTAGTGFIRVENSEGVSPVLPDQAFLTVGFGVMNFRVGINANAVRLHLVEDGTLHAAYQFYVDEALEALGASSCAVDAICAWNQKTQVDWEFDGTSPATGFGYDTYNLIFWDSSLIGSGNFAQTYIAPGLNNAVNCDTFWMVLETDIGINPETNWSFDCSGPSDTTKLDFMSTLTHELGHAHLLTHALPKGKVMYPHSKEGELKRTITSVDEAGGDNVMANNAIPPGCNALPIQPHTLSGCTNPVREVISIPAKVFPNPFQQEINIELALQATGNVEVRLYDFTGKIVKQVQLGKMPSSQQTYSISFVEPEVPHGIFLLQVMVDGAPFVTEKVIKF